MSSAARRPAHRVEKSGFRAWTHKHFLAQVDGRCGGKSKQAHKFWRASWASHQCCLVVITVDPFEENLGRTGPVFIAISPLGLPNPRSSAGTSSCAEFGSPGETGDYIARGLIVAHN